MTGNVSKTAQIFLRIFIVVVLIIVLYFDFIFINASHMKPGLYEHWPFIVSTVLVLISSIIIYAKFRSLNVIIYPVFSILISLGYFVHVYPYLLTGLLFPMYMDLRTIFMAVFLLIALIHFLIPSRITNSFLPLVLIISMSWVFINLIYYNVFTFYAMYYFSDSAGNISVTFNEISKNMINLIINSALCIPFLVVFLLAKYANKVRWLNA